MEKDSSSDIQKLNQGQIYRKGIKMNKTVVSAFIAAVIVAVAAFAYQSYTGTSTTEAPMPAAEMNGIASSSGEAAPATTEAAPAADAAAPAAMEAAPAADAAAPAATEADAAAPATTEETKEEEKAAE